MSTSQIDPQADTSIASDTLEGADQIAQFLFGSPRHRRKVYHLARTSRLPVFKLGAKLNARRSVLLAFIQDQENRCRLAQSPNT